uniref:Uncharacterized protein n=1 Tax=Romanomermis culicivorax TaxID=13658 RepID=A0A915KN49_ROMCU
MKLRYTITIHNKLLKFVRRSFEERQRRHRQGRFGRLGVNVNDNFVFFVIHKRRKFRLIFGFVNRMGDHTFDKLKFLMLQNSQIGPETF